MLLAQLLLALTTCPAPTAELADRQFFLLCHSSAYKIPLWVAYQLTPSQLAGTPAKHLRFRADLALTHPGAQDSDYRHSGYSRGHLAPAADFAYSDDALRATYLLSNAVPQSQKINAGRWAQLERLVRGIAANSDVAYVISGPIFEGQPTFIGDSNVAVPTNFFKAVLVIKGGQKSMLAAVVPNSTTGAVAPLNNLLTTVDEVERRTGLDLFSALDDAEEDQLEAESSTRFRF